MANKIQLQIDEVEALAAQGLTHEQIALSLGIGTSTLYAKKATDPEILEALKRGKAKGIAKVSNALFKNATVNNNLGAQVFYLKNQAGWKDKIEQEHNGSLVINVLKLGGADPSE